MAMFECDQCDKTFTKPETFRKHKYRSHSIRPNAVLFNCYHCSYTTKYKFNLSKHVKIHSRPPQPKANASHVNVCGLCKTFQCPERGAMIRHYQDAHDVQIVECKLSFPSDEEFSSWKRDVETSESCRFVIGGTKKRLDATVKYLRCFRDGHYTPEGMGKRRLKVKGSSKIGSVCPSSMKVIKNSTTGAISVTYIARHVGHPTELGRMTLSKEEKDVIAVKLSAGVPVGAILDSFRQSLFKGQVNRLHLTTRKDVLNIKSSLRRQDELTQPSDDCSSVEAWLSTLTNYSNVVRFYKAQLSEHPSHPELKEEDFVLILAFSTQLQRLQRFGNDCVCFDRVQRANEYLFELTTLFVQDDDKYGLPCAYMVSNRTDSDIMALFLGVIKKLLKTPINPEVLMSDPSEVYVGAWTAVMSSSVSWLYSPWHVVEAWRNNLSLIPDSTKRRSIYQLLRALADEPDESVFSVLLEELMEVFREDADLSEFAEYFSEEYSGCVKRWAFCYRRYYGIDADMFEAVQEVSKRYYLEGKKVKRLDRGLSALLKFARIKMIKETPSQTSKLALKLKSIRYRHDSSNQLKCQIIPIENGWMITSDTKHDLYIVTKANVVCDCSYRCEICRVCEHEYRCTCPDSVKFNMCKHIHKTVIHIKQTATPKTDSGELLVTSDSKDAFEEVIYNEPNDAAFEESKRALSNEVSALIQSSKNEAQLEAIRKALLPVSDSMRTLEPRLTHTS